jgi:hypothetical protein
LAAGKRAAFKIIEHLFDQYLHGVSPVFWNGGTLDPQGTGKKQAGQGFLIP